MGPNRMEALEEAVAALIRQVAALEIEADEARKKYVDQSQALEFLAINVGLADGRLTALESAQPSVGFAEFGKGLVIVDNGTVDGVPAVFLRPAPVAGVVGERASDDDQGPLDRLLPGDVCMTFPTDGQARRVADALVGREAA